MKKFIFLLVGILVISTAAMARDYQYISAAELQKRIETNKQGLLLDIQVEDEFSEHHIESAVATHAFPVKSDQDKQKLQAVLWEDGHLNPETTQQFNHGGDVVEMWHVTDSDRFSAQQRSRENFQC